MRNIDYFLKNGWLLGHENSPAIDRVPASSKVRDNAEHQHNCNIIPCIYLFIIGTISSNVTRKNAPSFAETKTAIHILQDARKIS